MLFYSVASLLLYKNIQKYTKIYKNIQKNTKKYKNIQKNIKNYKNIKKYRIENRIEL